MAAEAELAAGGAEADEGAEQERRGEPDEGTHLVFLA
jgi:hypothetical protein